MASKRKLSELSNDEKSDAVVQLEKRLNAEFDRAHGSKAAQLEKAHADARAALAVLASCQVVANQPHTGAFDAAEIQRIYTEFDEIYPPVEAPSMAFKHRHPTLFGHRDNRSEAAKRKDEAIVAAGRDALVLDAMVVRNRALIQLNKHIHTRVSAFNDAVTYLRQMYFLRYQSDEATQMIRLTEHK